MAFTPRILHDAAIRPTEPQAVVETFLAALAANDVDDAADLMDERITYVNVGMPPIRGRRRAIAVLRPLARPHASFEVYLHAIAVNGGTVLTDRTDVLTYKRLRLQFWVTGRFEVRDGRITLWRDSFDYVDLFRSFVRGVAGVVVPSLRPAAPPNADVQPGRHYPIRASQLR
jgi:limonene-1,2-epoxide hydrolase